MARDITHAWYVTFEPKKAGLLAKKRRTPRLTATFLTEIEAKNFARSKFSEGLTVFAGTLNPLPKQIIYPNKIADWLAS